MTWFKVDDGLAFHAKVVQAGNPAMGLWVRAGSWSAQQLTDGFIPDHIAATLGTRAQAKALTESRLWVRFDGGYQFHGWNEDGRQPTREQVEKDRSEARDRMRKAREAKRGSGDVRANTERSSGDVRVTRPDPSRPDLSTTDEKGGSHVSRDAASTPPLYPDRCQRHANVAVPGNCGDCKDTREANAARPRLSIVATVPAKVPHCGQCDEFRMVETASGQKRCPTCNPLAGEAINDWKTA